MSIIHLLTPITTRGIRQLDDIAHLAGPDVTFTHSLLDRGPPSIESEFDEAFAVPDTIIKAIEAERSGADAIVIDCMGDPGLKPVREVVRIPVLGPAETSMHLAAMLGRKFSTVVISNAVRPIAYNLARIYGVDGKLASVRAIDVPVLEIEARADEVRQRIAGAALKAVEDDDADVIILGCTGFFGLTAAVTEHLLAAGHDVPVIDPMPATVCVASAIVKAGLRHSKRTYPTPRAKTMTGFDIPVFDGADHKNPSSGGQQGNAHMLRLPLNKGKGRP